MDNNLEKGRGFSYFVGTSIILHIVGLFLILIITTPTEKKIQKSGVRVGIKFAPKHIVSDSIAPPSDSHVEELGVQGEISEDDSAQSAVASEKPASEIELVETAKKKDSPKKEKLTAPSKKKPLFEEEQLAQSPEKPIPENEQVARRGAACSIS